MVLKAEGLVVRNLQAKIKFICPDVEQKQELVRENKGREGVCLQTVISICSYETKGFSEHTLKLGKASLLSSLGDECCDYVTSLFGPVTAAPIYLEQVMGELKGLR